MPVPTVTVCSRSVFGKTAIYPACPKAEAFARIAGSRTLTSRTLIEIRALGFAIVDIGGVAQQIAGRYAIAA